MIGYTILGTNKFDQALDFYNKLMVLLGEKQLWKTESMAAWGVSRGEPAFCIAKPFNGKSANVGNGIMVAFKVETSEQVNAFHSKAIELGGTCAGKLGKRGDNGFYAGYFRDLDGNKLNVYNPASRI